MNLPRFHHDWRKPDAPEVTNMSVRIEDHRAFRDIIQAREKLIERKVASFIAKDHGAQRLTEQVANCALDAFIEMGAARPNVEDVKSRLALTAAMAIAALNELEGGEA